MRRCVGRLASGPPVCSLLNGHVCARRGDTGGPSRDRVQYLKLREFYVTDSTDSFPGGRRSLSLAIGSSTISPSIKYNRLVFLISTALYQDTPCIWKRAVRDVGCYPPPSTA